MSSPAWLIPKYGRRAAVPPERSRDIARADVEGRRPRYELNVEGRTVPKQGAFRVEHDGSKWRIPFVCPLEFEHGPEYQAEARREYEHWHRALQGLAIACNEHGSLGRLVVTGPAIAPRPWISSSSRSS